MKKIIAFIVAIIVLFCVSCCAEMALKQDFVTTDSTGYIWIGDMDCTHSVLRIDYPDYGIGEGQNVRLELNDLPTVMLWHDNGTTYTVFSIEYLGDEIFATGACGGSPMILSKSVQGICDTKETGIMWGAIAGNAIPSGTRIRVWSDAE